MPQYTYKCPECGDTLDVTHSIKDCDNPQYHMHEGFAPVRMHRVPAYVRANTNGWAYTDRGAIPIYTAEDAKKDAKKYESDWGGNPSRSEDTSTMGQTHKEAFG